MPSLCPPSSVNILAKVCTAISKAGLVVSSDVREEKLTLPLFAVTTPECEGDVHEAEFPLADP